MLFKKNKQENSKAPQKGNASQVDAKAEAGGEKQFASRFLALKVGFALFFVLIAGRLAQIQIMEASKYQATAKKQYEQAVVLPAVRGNIYDRNSNVVASNTMNVSFAADPKIIDKDAERIAEKFSEVFNKPKSYYLSKLRTTNSSGTPKRFVWLERRAKPELGKRIEAMRLEGIVPINEAKRLYHYDEVAGTLLGFTDIDSKGISGIELQLDEYLRGKNGSVIMQRDGLGGARPSVDYPRIEPFDGNDVTLTLDLAYQSIVEEELKKGVEHNKADAALAVMLNPKTGEILALATSPGINPNGVNASDINASRNRVVTDMFEPGSVFKVVTASAAYENKLFTPDKRFNAEHGVMNVALPRGKMRQIKDTHAYDWISFQEAIELSSNIVMAKASELIGAERLYREARDFGFGVMTGVDLPGEVKGRLKKPNEWSGTTLQTLAYGYEVGVTPLQIALAYAAVANKGVMMKPYIVSKVRTKDDEEILAQKPQTVRKVISPETANLLTQAFEGVVERGTGKDVRIAGMRIAGKTGTSKKYVDGKYTEGSYTASFVGFFPVEDPQVVCLVMMDNPRAAGYYGGITSGPVFHAIAERIINSTGRFTKTPTAKEKERNNNGITVPDVRTLQINIASKILEGQGLKSELFGKGDVVVRQIPEPGKRLEKGDVVKLVLNGEETNTTANGAVVVPELKGMSLRRAINRLVVDDFDVKVRGSGVVVSQYPAAGQKVNAGATVQIICEPRAVTAALY
ncbi:MAG: PASTA domain-containing protein [Ignavibacteriales bacterium]|nr:PASTA domain-containing protein [Ignavibacteriales bacterium]